MGGDLAIRLRRLQQRLGEDSLLLDPEACDRYAGDKWHASRRPAAVALPRTAREAGLVLKFCSRHGIPLTARGAGHGYVGGCVPARGGIVLSTDRMNRIREIHRADFVAVAGAGVITQVLQQRVEKQGLFYPPDPASRADCTLGGNIATNAGGPRCLKYGVTRDYVLGLEVVLADGAIARLGGRTHKNKTGFDLARFFVGSEGLLGIVTEATLKLLPLPPFRASLSMGFSSMVAAARAIRRIFEAGHLPCALEIADAFTLKAARERTGRDDLAGCQAHLIVEIDGHEEAVALELKAMIREVTPCRPRFVHQALGSAACEHLWQLRREFSYALRDTGLKKINEDIVVPRGRLIDLFRFASALEKKHGLPLACFGHAGDGNIHVNLMVDEHRKGSDRRTRAALDELFAQVLAWEGVITGEHGIGLAKKPWWPAATTPAGRRLHRTIKRALDPAGILNPGKFV